MSKKHPHYISNGQMKSLTADQKKLLDTLTKFYFDVIGNCRSGIIRKPKPREFYEFVINNTDGKRKAKRINT
jgi:hypothetical protein